MFNTSPLPVSRLNRTADYRAWCELTREVEAELGLAILVITPGMNSATVAKGLYRVLGRRKALWARTKLSQIAEAQDGRRQGRRGRDRVRKPQAPTGYDLFNYAVIGEAD